MTKLLVTSGNYASGGAERVLSVLSKGFCDAFTEVVYLSWLDTPDFYKFDERIKRVCVEKECKSHNNLKMGLWLRKYVKRERFTVILSFLEPWNVLLCGSLLGVKVPVVVADRNDPRVVWNDLFHGTIRKLMYRRAQGIACQTEHNRSYYKGSLLEKSHVIFNPVFLPEEYIGKALKQEKENKIVSVVRLEPQKNIPMLLRAFAAFHANHHDYKLVIYGEGKLRPELESQIKEMALTDSVEMPGAQKGVWDLIVSAKCFALSSWNEGMPNAMLEALCLGLPCVATKVSGAVDLIKSSENGLLVDLDDDRAMADCFEKVATDSELAQSLGQEATHTYDLLRQEKISKEWVDYLKTFVKE